MSEVEIVLMHQGGWDEALMLLGPLAIIAALIYTARKGRPPDGEEWDDDWEEEDWEKEPE
ncbi:hypothetical protein [Hoyosella subflava]|uniref:Uncharacterized protein n=1 Tax=Hoyosella subflava (strain DSM 45089 / JCM 17490 / NBRC 109087 / DQS3-9A1) TaxID=443218 RepID=F6ELU9_HOYSD|nr:hypothetical protein [Hoyosella subflava]AEF41547.1 hypothetical protein AS9A_3102 [Hoyosella subflava DQS3-9A1]